MGKRTSDRKPRSKGSSLVWNQRMLQNILSASPLGISYFEDGKIKWTNHTMVELFGGDREEDYLDKTPQDFYQSEREYQRVRKIFYNSLNAGRVAQADARFKRKDGSTFYGHVRISALDPSDPRKGTITTIFDVSARKKAEEALRQSEEKYRKLYEESIRAEEIYRSLLNSSPDAIVIYDMQGRVKYVSDSFTRMFGWSLDELEGRRIPYVPESEREVTKARIDAVVHAGIPSSAFETSRFTKDGRILQMSISASRYLDHEGNPAGMLGILRDITERKQAEQALAQSEKQFRLLSAQLLTAQENERKRLAQELHDGIGQSLSAIKFRLDNILKQADPEMDPAQTEPIHAIIPLIQNTIEEIRRISMDLRPSILDDLGILATITWFCREFQATYSGIHIVKRISVEEQDMPEPLKIVIFRVLQEAINNVAKHSRAHQVRISLDKIDGKIELVIQDDGVGMDANGGSAPETVRKGFGLASMRERTEQSGGAFTIERVDGTWTVIRYVWPQEKSPTNFR
jgi:PAS domain S-box-containing protein